MTELDRTILDIVNNWNRNLSFDTEESECVKYESHKNKFREKYMRKTGQFLQISKKIESCIFNKICHGLSQNYTFSEDLLDKYIDWSFDNYDFFVKQYKIFNLNSMSIFASEWKDDFLVFEDSKKVTYDSLSTIDISKGVFGYCEQFGIPFSVTKLSESHKGKKEDIKQIIYNKLLLMTKTNDGLNRLKNMLRTTVENGPYDKIYIFHDYRTSLRDLFKYFSKEPWGNV